MIAYRKEISEAMDSDRSVLRDPQKPPLSEMGISFQFEELKLLNAVEIGRFWSESLRSEFPRVEEASPVDFQIEVETFRPPTTHGIQLRLITGPGISRFLFVDDSDTRLVQIQRNLFGYNWRMRGELYDYPKFPEMKQRFSEYLERFSRFIVDEKLGEFAPYQCELLYANSIEVDSGRPRPHRDLGQLLRHWDSSYQGTVRAKLEDLKIQARHEIRDDEDRFVGRLYMDVSPGYRLTEKIPTYQIQLSARGKLSPDSIDGVFGFLDLAHSELRSAFSALIDEHVQEDWMRNDDEGN